MCVDFALSIRFTHPRDQRLARNSRSTSRTGDRRVGRGYAGRQATAPQPIGGEPPAARAGTAAGVRAVSTPRPTSADHERRAKAGRGGAAGPVAPATARARAQTWLVSGTVQAAR